MDINETKIIIKKFEDFIFQGNINIAINGVKYFLESQQSFDITLNDSFYLFSSQFIENEKNYKSGLLSFEDYNNLKSKCTLNLLGLIRDIRSHYRDQLEAPNNDGFSQVVLEELKKLGIDVLILSEIKRDVLRKEFHIENYYHKYIIDNSDLWQEVVLEGKNTSNEIMPCITFVSSSTVATPVKDMNVTGHCLLENNKLHIRCHDEDRNLVKKFTVYFKKPLKKNEKFKIQYRFLNKETMSLSGRDFLSSFISTEEPVENYSCTIEFIHNSPEFVLCLDVSKKHEMLLYPNEKTFILHLNKLSYLDLNNLRLLYSFVL